MHSDQLSFSKISSIQRLSEFFMMAFLNSSLVNGLAELLLIRTSRRRRRLVVLDMGLVFEDLEDMMAALVSGPSSVRCSGRLI